MNITGKSTARARSSATSSNRPVAVGGSRAIDRDILAKGAAYRDRTIKLKRIRKAAESGHSGKLRLFIEAYLRSHAAKVTAADRAIKGANRPSDAECHELALMLNAWSPPKQPIFHKGVPKPDGGVRNTYSYRRETKALQHLVADVLAAACPAPEFIYKAKRNPADHRRQEEAIQFITRQLSGDDELDALEYSHAVLLDIKDCYDSTNPEPIPDLLPLPRAVVEAVILCHGQQIISRTRTRPRGSYLRRTSHSSGSLHKASGAPQGSIVSDVVMTTLFADLDQQVPAHAPLCLFGDDVCVLSTTAIEAHAIAHRMRTYFAEHPAGPYALKRCEVIDVRDGFDFLGYEITVEEGGVTLGLAVKSRRKLAAWIGDELVSAFRRGEYLVPDSLGPRLARKLGGYRLLHAPEAHLEWLLRLAQSALDAAVGADNHGWDGDRVLRGALSCIECQQPSLFA